MSEIIELADRLKGQADTFETKKKLFFTSIIHKPSGEKVVEGFRYFAAPIEALVAAFESGDLAAIEALPYALDDDGDPDTTSVCLLLAYTEGGAFLAAQPQEYRDYEPFLVREPKYFTATGAQAAALDQSS